MQRCVYCLGFFEGRADAETCSGACREARRAALQADDVSIRPWARRETYSAERAKATGWGAMMARAAYYADLRMRLAAGLDVPELPPHAPGYSADDIQYEYAAPPVVG